MLEMPPYQLRRRGVIVVGDEDVVLPGNRSENGVVDAADQ
jgi:hypothetical protein